MNYEDSVSTTPTNRVVVNTSEHDLNLDYYWVFDWLQATIKEIKNYDAYDLFCERFLFKFG